MQFLPYGPRAYKCQNCGHEQEIRTNHDGGCLDYCKGCSWKPSFGEDGAFPMFGRTYRRFECIAVPSPSAISAALDEVMP